MFVTILVNAMIYGLVTLAGYLVYKKYDKKLLDGNVITEKQVLTAIVGALFASILAANILHIINNFLLGDSFMAGLVGLLILVAQFYVMYYGIILLLQKQKIMLSKKAAHLFSHKLSIMMIIALVLISILFGIISIVFFLN